MLSLLSVDGGTILVPGNALADDQLDELIERLSRAARVPIAATMIYAPAQGIPDAADQAHELLDIVHRLRLTRGLFRFDELALGISSPGRDRDAITSAHCSIPWTCIPNCSRRCARASATT